MATEQPSDKDIFNFARQLDSQEAIETYLDQVCGDDPSRRERILKLVEADKGDSFLERPAVPLPDTVENQSPVEREGQVVGNYKLLQKIGEGGFGVVYMAEQTHPVRRQVALKIIKPGMESKEVIARFEAERQALAMMDHPNIAKVFDGGQTELGHPYFVMELVKGVPLTKFCDENKLDTRDRLRLFESICNAIQHAHQKGIIHRDIKPSNVLVTLHDGKPVPKVIDFGVAKAISQQLTANTLFTKYGQMVGTPQYMSPEQAEMSGLDIDTRSDIYSLGVLLYELLTGTTPIDPARLRQTGYAEMQRMIREEEPPIPSKRLSSLREQSIRIASNRKSDVRALYSTVHGELDWIVMKALDKDRNRRYETANSFGLDVQSYLNGDAVRACPPSTGYLIKKAYQRNKRAALFGGALVTILATSLAFVTVSWFRERESRKQAIAAEARARSAEKQTQQELYISDMIAAHDSINSNNIRRAVQLLLKYSPEDGLSELRRWDWYYLWGLCSRASEAQWIPQDECALSVEFAPDGASLAVGRPDGVFIHQPGPRGWTIGKSLERSGWHGTFARYSSTHGILAYQTNREDGLTLVRGNNSRTYPAGRPFVFSSSGKYFAALHRDRLVVCDTDESWKSGELKILASTAFREHLADELSWKQNITSFSPDDSQVAVGLLSGDFKVWDWRSEEIPCAHPWAAKCTSLGTNIRTRWFDRDRRIQRCEGGCLGCEFAIASPSA